MKYHYLRSCLAKLALLESRREKVWYNMCLAFDDDVMMMMMMMIKKTGGVYNIYIILQFIFSLSLSLSLVSDPGLGDSVF
jgi:hypothetical protein